MTREIEGVTVERIWDSMEPFIIYKLPSGYTDKVLMVYEDPHDVYIRVVTEEEYRKRIQDLSGHINRGEEKS